MIEPIAMSPAFLHAAAEEGLGAKTAKPGGRGFGDVLQNLMRETDELQKLSESAVQGFGTGQVEDVHDVMIAMTKADLSFRMMLEVRNKLVDAYTEIMRMQV